MFPKIIPFSVDATLTLALILAKSFGASTKGWNEKKVKRQIFPAVVHLRLLHQLEVPEGGQLQGAGLQRVPGLVDDQNVQHNVVLIDIDVGLGIYRVREASQLGHLKGWKYEKQFSSTEGHQDSPCSVC